MIKLSRNNMKRSDNIEAYEQDNTSGCRCNGCGCGGVPRADTRSNLQVKLEFKMTMQKNSDTLRRIEMG